MRKYLGLAALLALASANGSLSFGAPVPPFDRVLPILISKCTACHGAGQPMAGLDLRSAASMLRGSKNGPVVVKGSAGASRLCQRISAHEMPPASAEALSDSEIRIIGEWIDSGGEVAGGEVKAESQ